MKAKAELYKDTRIKVEFPYHPKAVQVVRDIPGARFVPREKGGPFWTLPLSMVSGRALKVAFAGDDDEIVYGKKLLEWGKQERERERNLGSLALQEDAKLPRLEELEVYMAEELRRTDEQLAEKGLPPGYDEQPLHKWMRDYQRVSAAFMAKTSCLNGDQQGLGKTIEWIAAVYEAELEDGYHLVSAPVTSLETVWAPEIEKWMDTTILTGDTPKKRELALEVAIEMFEAQEPFVLLVNPDMIIMKWEEVGQEDKVYAPKHPGFEKIDWDSVDVDEFHKMGMGNPKTAKREAHIRIGRKAKRFWPMTGTPMGGKPIKMWGALNAIEPKKFSSKWQFAGHYLEITENDYGKTIEGVRPDKEDELAELLMLHMVRHLKKDVAPELPAKQYIDVWCKMAPKQQKQYEAFAKEAEIKIETERLSAMGILDEYTRLKQFACAYQKVEKVEVGRRDKEGNKYLEPRWLLTPQVDACGKLPYLIDKLAEAGITPKDPEGDSVAVVASQFKPVVKMIHDYLNKIGIPAEMITGDVKEADRTELVKRFQNGGKDSPRVIVVTTTAAGTALTLDRADTVHLMDETWNPDDQEQLEDRIHRISRIHQVMCFYYRTKDSIEEYIEEVNSDKLDLNKRILDMRREGLRADRHAEKAAA